MTKKGLHGIGVAFTSAAVRIGFALIVLWPCGFSHSADGGLRRLAVFEPDDYRAKWAVIIGIDTYPGGTTGLPRLRFAVNDARELRQTLIDDFGYRPESIVHITDEQASREGIREVVETRLSRMALQVEDSLLFFFAGHGLIDEDSQHGYLATVDSNVGNLRDSCLPVTWLRDALQRLPCRHKLVILDSCYSGHLFDKGRVAAPLAGSTTVTAPSGESAGTGTASTRGSLPPPNERATDRLSNYLLQPAFMGVSAGRDTPVDDGRGADRHSVFTRELLQALRDRCDSVRPDQAFTLAEVATRVESRVRDAPDVESNQIPKWGYLGVGDGDFVFRPTAWRMTPREESRRRTYVEALDAAQRAWALGDVTRMRAVLQSQISPTQEPLRGFEWFHLWRLAHGTRLNLASEKAWPAALDFGPDGCSLAVGACDGGLGMLTMRGDYAFSDISGDTRDPHAYHAVAYSPDGRLIAAAGHDEVAIWSVADKSKAIVPMAARRLVFDGNGARLAASDGARKLWLINPVNAGILAELLEPEGAEVGDIVFSADDKDLLAAVSVPAEQGHRLAVHRWDMGGQRIAAELTDTENVGIPNRSAIALAKNGALVAASVKGTDPSDPPFLIRFWRILPERNGLDSRDAHGQGLMPWPQPSEPTQIKFSPDTTLAAAATDRSIRLWHLAAGYELANHTGHRSAVNALAFAPDGRSLASGAGRIMKRQGPFVVVPGELRLLNIRDMSTETVLGDSNARWSHVTYSPDGTLIAMAGMIERRKQAGVESRRRHPHKVIHIWDVPAERLLREIDLGEGTEVGPIAFGPDVGAITAFHWGAGLNSTEALVTTWEVDSGRQTRTQTKSITHNDHVVACSPDGATFALAGIGGVRIWKSVSGEDMRLDGVGGQDSVLAYSQDGSVLATSAFGSNIVLWDVASQRRRSDIANHGRIRAMVFAPSSATLFTGTHDGIVRQWDAMSGMPVGEEFPPHPTPIRTLAVSPDGLTLAVTSCEDDFGIHRTHELRLWNVALRRPMMTRELLCDSQLTFAPDGRTLTRTAGQIINWHAAHDQEVRVQFRPTGEEPSRSHPSESPR